MSPHAPSSVRLAAGNAARHLGPAMDIDLLRIIRAAVSGPVGVIVSDLEIAVGIAARAAPVIARMRPAGFKAAVIGVDLVTAVLAIQAVVADRTADHAAKDGAHSRTRATLRAARDGIAEQAAGQRADDCAARSISRPLPLALAQVSLAVESTRAIPIIIVAVALILIALLLIAVAIVVVAVSVVVVAVVGAAVVSAIIAVVIIAAVVLRHDRLDSA